MGVLIDAGTRADQSQKLGIGCFNKTWDYLDKESRTPIEIEEMIHAAHCSFYHWSQVKDVTPTNFSIGTWQLSRVYAVADFADRSRHYAERCVEISEGNDLPSFYVAYAYEAMARARALAGESEEASTWTEKARSLLKRVENLDERKILSDDLEGIL